MNRAWMSGVMGNYTLGDRPGTRTKRFGRDWEPARDEVAGPTEAEYQALRRSLQGFALNRDELPEAMAVWNQRRFGRFGDIFFDAGYLVVAGKLAETLNRADLGNGGLVPYPVFKADLQTPYPREFYLLNLGARKDTLLAERSTNVAKFAVDHKTGRQVWEVYEWSEGKDLALSSGANSGPELWVEETLYNKLFFSDALAQAIIELGMKDIFRLQECRVLET